MSAVFACMCRWLLPVWPLLQPHSAAAGTTAGSHGGHTGSIRGRVRCVLVAGVVLGRQGCACQCCGYEQGADRSCAAMEDTQAAYAVASGAAHG
jgi:hypothetical protein